MHCRCHILESHQPPPPTPEVLFVKLSIFVASFMGGVESVVTLQPELG